MTRNESFNYVLPKERIAARPVKPYDSAKLLVVDREQGSIKERIFSELDSCLKPGDVLILNNTRVDKARLFGAILPQGKASEFLIMERGVNNSFTCIARPMKLLNPGTKVKISNNLELNVLERVSEKVLTVELTATGGDLESEIENAAVMPIPPYIRDGKGDLADVLDYQTIFAEQPGSIAAPTASLHFTSELFSRLKASQIKFEFVTLHIGMYSVQSAPEKDGAGETPGRERFKLDSDLKRRIKEHKAAGRRIVCVGTSAARALESQFSGEYDCAAGEFAETELFIQPGYEFKCVDALITNFHLPGSTHLLLVQALLGGELLDKAYQYALSGDFRFLSYGDAMLIE